VSSGSVRFFLHDPFTSMAPLLLHFGVDDCYRVPLLRRAGYSVEDCHSLRRLRSALIEFPEPDAVAIAVNDEIEANEAVSLVRWHCTSPLVLFQTAKPFYETSDFNLVVPSFTHPREWLFGIALLIAESRTLRDRSRQMREVSASLRAEVAAAREKTRLECERTRQELARNADLIRGRKPDSGSGSLSK
jgi:hypothetical protein